MTNAVRHSGAREDLEVGLGFAGSDLVAEVVDHGHGFDTTSFDPDAPPDVTKPGGRGLFLIAQLMDELELRIDVGLEVHAVKRGVLNTSTLQAPDQPSTALPGAKAHREARERELLEEIDEGFFALDWEYRFRLVNSAFERLYGRDRGTLLGLTIWEAFPSFLASVAQALREAMELGKPSIVEYLSPTVGRWVELRTYPNASGIVAYSRDIDERKRKEARTRPATRDRRRERGEFRRGLRTVPIGRLAHAYAGGNHRARQSRLRVPLRLLEGGVGWTNQSRPRDY